MPTATKLDLFKKHAKEYVAPREPVLLTIGPARYLVISGRGSPQESDFQQRIGALYAVAFTVKMASKFAGRDYVVSKIEGLWWLAKKHASFMDAPRKDWRWMQLLRVPTFIGRRELAAALVTLRAKDADPLVEEVRIETLREGRCVQALHVGGYEEEAPTIAKMRALAQSRGLDFRGKHHEIYLSDPRRVPKERLRTILRQPVG